MLTGRRAFERPSIAETMSAILTEEPRALDTVRADLGRILRHCLKKHAHERFQSARDLAFDLRNLATPLAINDAPADSLAVLPFANAGGADAEYLSDGIAENLINSFSQIARLRVVPRSVAFRYKGQEVNPRDVARQLDVRMLLSGKVVDRGGRLSVQAELVDAVANRQLWGERVVRSLDDIFEVEEEIARQIADRLRLRLSGEDRKQLGRRYTEDSEAYQLYLKARYHFLKRTQDGLRLAIHYAEEAVAKDAGFALAHAALADCYMVVAGLSPAAHGETLAKARAAATRAVEADAMLAEAHNSLANVRVFDCAWAETERGFRHALELNPSSWITHDWYSLALACEGRLDEARAHNRRALELEPLSVVPLHHGAWLSWLARRNDEAVELGRRALELDAGFGWAHLWIGLALEQKAMLEDAVAALRQSCEMTGSVPMIKGSLAHACVAAGQRDEAERLLGQLEEPSRTAHVDAYALALVHAAFGRREDVFDSLEKARTSYPIWITLFVKCDPRFDPFRQYPRFREILRRMGLDS
jgi:TolB-like protein/Flp pilus assembly protein TadD